MIDSYDPFATLISRYILGGICEVRGNTVLAAGAPGRPMGRLFEAWV